MTDLRMDKPGTARTIAAAHFWAGRGIWREVAGLGMAALVAIFMLNIVPGNWLIAVSPIEVLPTHDGEILIIQRAAPRMPIAKQVSFAVEIVEIDTRLDDYTEDTVVCRGVSHWSLDAADTTELRILLRAWVDDPNCRLRRGFTYVFRMTLYFDVLGFSKAIERQSRAVTMPLVWIVPPPGTPDSM